jgi:GxxExxY protein
MIRPISSGLNEIARKTVDAAFRVHAALGPGLLESVYEVCMVHELHERGLDVRTQVALPVIYRGVRLHAGLRLDMLVNDELIVELKSVVEHHPVFEAQLLTYLKLSGHRLGLLINFNVPLIRDGIRRIIL